MRLSTLARKIDKTPTQLISYLEKQEIKITNGFHSKLDGETVEFILKQFLPEQQIEDPIPELMVEDETIIEAETVVPEKELSVEIIDEKIEDEEYKEEEKSQVIELEKSVNQEEIIEAPTPEVIEPKAEPKTGTLDDLENENSDEIELIKAKKVKLDGIKVVGKIDLPEKPTKEPSDDEPSTLIEKDEKPISRKKSIKPGNEMNSSQTNKRMSVGFEEKLRREERYKQRKIKQNALEEKKRKVAFYKNHVQPKTTPKVKKKKKVSIAAVPEQTVVSKNPIKRLWEWLNGKYDQY